MNLYPLLKPVLFQLDPETAHTVTLKLLKAASLTGLTQLTTPNPPPKPVQIMGLSFNNPLGLAAGLDKNGDYIDALAGLGFGFIEIGTVTPRPQPGNPKPRLFRLPQQQAIINRMGFNNLGIDHLIEQVQKSRFSGIIGINIGKNFDTPIAEAPQDYLIGMQKAYASASYITINISSPNTKNLRNLQQGDAIKALLQQLKEQQRILQQQHGKYVPVAVKIAPDLSAQETKQLAEIFLQQGIDGVIATNTTIDRSMISGHPLAHEAGGLSGAPVKEKSDAILKLLHAELGDKLPIIAAGGVMSAEDALDKIAAGASLVQIYSGLIYKGPELVSDIVKAI